MALAAPPRSCLVVRHGSRWHVVLAGRVDGPTLAGVVEAVAAPGASGDVVVDAGALTALDDTAVAVLVDLQAALGPAGRSLVLAHAAPAVRARCGAAGLRGFVRLVA